MLTEPHLQAALLHSYLLTLGFRSGHHENEFIDLFFGFFILT